jgi:hypothetical protein
MRETLTILADVEGSVSLCMMARERGASARERETRESEKEKSFEKISPRRHSSSLLLRLHSSVMPQLLLRGLPPPPTCSGDGDAAPCSSSSSSCVLLDDGWLPLSPEEAVATALIKQWQFLPSSSVSSSDALPLSHPLSHAAALALADKVRIVARR